MPQNYLFTSESVSEGHPDKVADRISDTILDAFLSEEAESRVAVETLVTQNLVVIAGEVRSNFTPDYDALIRGAIQDIGYDTEDFHHAKLQILNHVHGQSSEIAQGVDEGSEKEEGAGDQGLMFGYAVNETPDFMPAPIHYAHRLVEDLAERRHKGEVDLNPDSKSQITIRYENGKPVGIDTIVVSHQHEEHLDQNDVRKIALKTIANVLPQNWLSDETKIHVNPTGSFIFGGPAADTGLTGRKIIVDTYGGMSRHGGGAFSGKDPTKVDRSAAYAARYLAKNIVAAELAHCCEIQLCYAIGVAEPLAIYLDTFGTAKNGLSDDKIAKAVKKSMSLTPKGIRQHLQLNKPIYAKTSAYGHFGRKAEGDFFSWERTDLVEEILKNMG